jgi:mxaL protein
MKARLARALGDGRASLRTHRDRWLLGAAALLLAATLLHPRLPMERKLFEHVVVLDISQSMDVQDETLDGKPVSRGVYARHALRQALTRMPCGSKVGWAVFTEYRAFLVLAPVEVCENLSELRSTLANMDNRMAWIGGSEVAKGIHSGLVIAKQLPGQPSLVFITDGQEAPPLNPRHRPAFDDKPGEVAGLLVGVGQAVPSPIPKHDPQGRRLGFWGADEVLQDDPRSKGRGASVGGEKMADDTQAAAGPALGATPGVEHLSGLREPYLRLLASEQGLGFLRLQAPGALAAALTSPELAKPVKVQADLRPALALLALLLLLARHAGVVWARLRGWLPARFAASRTLTT